MTESGEVERMHPTSPSGSGHGADGLMRTVFRNSVWSTLAVVANPILQFLFGGLTLRYVGIDATGFSLAVSAALGIAGRLGTSGIGEAALPAIAASLAAYDDRRTRRLIGIVLAVYLATSITMTGLMLVGAGWFVRWSSIHIEAATAFRFIAICCATQVLTQIQQAATTVLRAASRYELVTMITTPLSFVSGLVACLVLPVFPSLLTVGILGLASATVGCLLTLAVTSAAVPAFRRPLAGLGELWGLARYGFWLSLTQVCNLLIGGVDDLVITGMCGAAAVPPWAIGKRFWNTAHTFLAQHCEHLIPTLGALRPTDGDAFARLAGSMHWYMMVLAATGYTLMAWCGDWVVGLVAGKDIGPLCRIPIFAFSLFGAVLALLIIPVTMALAAGASRPMFVVALLSNPAQLAAVSVIANFFGAPTVYYSPLAAIPFLLLATGTTPDAVFDSRAIRARLKPVVTPLTMGILGISAASVAPAGLTGWQRALAGAVLAVGVFASIVGVERRLGLNEAYHDQLGRVLRHALDLVTRLIGRGIWQAKSS